MIKIIGFIFLIFIVWLELKGPSRALDGLFYLGKLDKELIEPEEKVTLTHYLSNYSRLPSLFTDISTSFHKDTIFLEEEDWCKKHIAYAVFEPFDQYRMYLLGKSRWIGRVSFTFNKRGSYTIGKCYIETGDALGIRTEMKHEDKEQRVVVIPARRMVDSLWEAYSGYMGDISVQRFILEDPILTVGFREYTGHEPMKSISFTQTAKMGSMYVKCYDHTTEFNVTVLINMGGEFSEDKERCLEIGRTIIEDLEDRHICYGFDSNGDLAECLTPGLGQFHYTSIVKSMGLSKLICHSSLEELMERAESKQNRSNGYILITPPLSEKEKAFLHSFEQSHSISLCILEGGAEE